MQSNPAEDEVRITKMTKAQRWNARVVCYPQLRTSRGNEMDNCDGLRLIISSSGKRNDMYTYFVLQIRTNTMIREALPLQVLMENSVTNDGIGKDRTMKKELHIDGRFYYRRNII